MKSHAILQAAGHALSLSRTHVMAVLNLTPDSFSDGGSLFQGAAVHLDSVLQRAQCVAEEGANLFDLGGESTRPGAAEVTSAEECDRVLPVLEALNKEFDLPISVDTSNPELMRHAIRAGAFMINDVRALERSGALEAVCQADVAICLMHMKGQPGTMQHSPQYQSVATEVSTYLHERARLCEQAGVDSTRIVLDPGFGFGKTLQHNLQLFNGLLDSEGAFSHAPYPLLVGVSRKSMIGSILSKDGEPRVVSERVSGGLALATLAASHGVSIIRTHDVRATRDAVDVVNALRHNPA